MSPDSQGAGCLPPPARVILLRRNLPLTVVRNTTLPKATPDVDARLSHNAPRMLDVVGGVVVAAIETFLPLLRVRVLQLPKRNPDPSTGLSRAPASAAAPVLQHECWALSETVSSRSKMLQTCLLLRRGCRNGDAQGEESSDGWAPPLTSPAGSFAIERKERM